MKNSATANSLGTADAVRGGVPKLRRSGGALLRRSVWLAFEGSGRSHHQAPKNNVKTTAIIMPNAKAGQKLPSLIRIVVIPVQATTTPCAPKTSVRKVKRIHAPICNKSLPVRPALPRLWLRCINHFHKIAHRQKLIGLAYFLQGRRSFSLMAEQAPGLGCGRPCVKACEI